jgi:Rrf2 family protein
MFKVSRKSEYALIAVQHMSRHPYGEVVSVAELAAAETIPPNILAKVLQGLKRAGVLMATKGAGGGYRLARPVNEIRFLDVVRPFEEQIAVVTCQGADATATSCERTDGCGLRDPMAVLNAFLLRQFEQLTMDAFLQPHLILHAAPRSPSGLAVAKAARVSTAQPVSGGPAVRSSTGPA